MFEIKINQIGVTTYKDQGLKVQFHDIVVATYIIFIVCTFEKELTVRNEKCWPTSLNAKININTTKATSSIYQSDFGNRVSLSKTDYERTQFFSISLNCKRILLNLPQYSIGILKKRIAKKKIIIIFTVKTPKYAVNLELSKVLL